MPTTLGQKLRQLRDERDLGLRETARELDLTPPFLSDVEQGRRFPSDNVLSKFAEFFNTSVDELKTYDSRPPVAELKSIANANPVVGFALRGAVREIESGKLTPEELGRRIRGEAEED